MLKRFKDFKINESVEDQISYHKRKIEELRESFDDLDQDGKEDVEEEAWFEPEECEYCIEDCEESGIEYEKNFTWENGCWVCDNCGNSQ